ncbi:MAG: hypothetical protein WA874_07125, partial [Chryseosolibacter sp.]
FNADPPQKQFGKNMRYTTSADNKYPEGSIVFAKVAPDLKLLIRKYYQRIYYCAPADDKNGKERVYFERELLTPAS